MWQVLPGEYVQLGKQGSPRQGLVKPPPDLPPNSELLAPRSFRHAPCLGFCMKALRTRGFTGVPEEYPIRAHDTCAVGDARAMAAATRRVCLHFQCEPVRCRLEHSRPGTVSVSLSENDDEPQIRQRANYRNTEFLITTGVLASHLSEV